MAPLSTDEIPSYAAYGVGASIGYVGRLASFLFYELLRDPDLLAAVRDEVRAAFADGIADARDVRRMPVLRSAYHEDAPRAPLRGRHAVRRRDAVRVPRPHRGPGARLIVSPVPSSFSAEAFPTRCASMRRGAASRATSTAAAGCGRSVSPIAPARRWVWSR
ncbi:MAG: hypothetical protein R2708_24175 [Vicinamibacterales bacterium]